MSIRTVFEKIKSYVNETRYNKGELIRYGSGIIIVVASSIVAFYHLHNVGGSLSVIGISILLCLFSYFCLLRGCKKTIKSLVIGSLMSVLSLTRIVCVLFWEDDTKIELVILLPLFLFGLFLACVRSRKPKAVRAKSATMNETMDSPTHYPNLKESNDDFDIFYNHEDQSADLINTSYSPMISSFENVEEIDDSLEVDDSLLIVAIDVVVECQAASTTLLQRKLRLGYARAARIMDQLEQIGVVGPADGAKPRKVLMTQMQLANKKINGDFANCKIGAIDYVLAPIESAIQGGEFYNDSLLRAAIRYAAEEQNVSLESLQKKFHLSTLQAQQLIRDLEYLRIIDFSNSHGIQKVLVRENHISKLFDLLGRTEVKEEFRNRWNSFEYTIQRDMTGYEFESYCCDLLQKNGFVNVAQTKLSGDDGIDILAEKDGIKYAIQCKCYSSPIGNKAVQEAFTGARLYHCDIAVVMTNSTFTPQAIRTAEETRVRLWDGTKLATMSQVESS